MRRVRIALAQVNTIVGDLEGNTRKICDYIGQAHDLAVDIMCFPELVLTGYPPEDLLLKPNFVRGNISKLSVIAEKSGEICSIVGFVDAQKDLFNAAAVIYDKKVIGIYHKSHLPNLSALDEYRYFHAGTGLPIFQIGDITYGINIGEDIWYPEGPINIQVASGAEVIINISSSPFHQGKGVLRKKILASKAADNEVFLAFVNLVGGQDGLIFDGHSLIFNERGNLIKEGSQFKEELMVADLDIAEVFRGRLNTPPTKVGAGKNKLYVAGKPIKITAPSRLHREEKPALPEYHPIVYSEIGEVKEALVVGTKDYMHKNGFKKAVIGLSGGIDSSVVAVIAVNALGSENVIGAAMPSMFTSEASIKDAEQLAENLGMRLINIPVTDVYHSYLEVLGSSFNGLPLNITEENIQARIRGSYLMALSNKFGWLVLSTGNKSEYATGYCTLYGDMAGGFAVLKDVYKTMVYKIANYINSESNKIIIPQNSIDRPPSAELKPDQKDIDTLPPYDILDAILKEYVEEDRSAEEIVAMGFNKETVNRVIKMVDGNEYKRRQSPPGVKITPRAFGSDRRLPITNKYSDNLT